MSKKKIKKMQKEAEQQMESAERLSKLMDMFESGEISATEFNELMNSDTDVSDIEIDNEINGLLSGALGKFTSNSNGCSENDLEVYVTNQGPRIDMDVDSYHPSDYRMGEMDIDENKLTPLTPTEVQMMLSQKMLLATKESTPETIKRQEPSTVITQNNDEIWTSGYCDAKEDETVVPEYELTVDENEYIIKSSGRPAIIPGISDVITDVAYPSMDDVDDGDDLFGSPNHLMLVDEDDMIVTITGKYTGFVACMQLLGEECKFNYSDIGFANPKDMLDIIRSAIVFCSGEYLISSNRHGMESLLSSVTNIDDGKFMIYNINHKIDGIDPYYIMYNWSDDVEEEFYELIEWLEENDLLLAFAKGICDLASNSSIFPLYEDPKRTVYASHYWAEPDEVEDFINMINSDADTEFGVISENDFSEKCTKSLDLEIDKIASLYEKLSTIYYNKLSNKKDDKVVEEQNVKEEVVNKNINIPEIDTTAEVAIVTETTVEVEIDEVEDTNEIELSTKRTEAGENKYIMTPIM